jgi:DNA-directed RNA polymerase I subunit RPA2
MTPDVLINPHAFPSRMTIGMLIESMAGKAGAMHGMFHDATPFQFHEERRAIDYFGEQLRSSGYSYYGSEPLYNGLTGNLMHADIFIGVVFYQRLRHMVSDKAQARSTGPVVALTRQPVKGRKKHGGIRLGEMERDSLLSHGVAFCLQDRLMNCSDAHVAYACSKCQSLLTVYSRSHAAIRNAAGNSRHSFQFCIKCKSGSNVKSLNLPYVYRFLTNDLAAMGIKLSINIADY